MGQFLFYYQRPEPSTWVYLSSFLVVGVYFMFHRLWSLRNLDIALLLLLTPGLMLVYEGGKKRVDDQRSAQLDRQKLAVGFSTLEGSFRPKTILVGTRQEAVKESSPGESPSAIDRWPGDRLQYWGFVWLLSVCGLIVLRMLLDTAMVRRPLLEPNLSSGGLAFIGVSLFLFLMANVLTSTPSEQRQQGSPLGPGYVLLNMLPDIQTTPAEGDELNSSGEVRNATSPASLLTVARILAIVANLVLVLGVVAIAGFHFGNIKTGIGAATLILLLPYTAQMSGRVDHVVPGALLVVALLLYRRPVFSGMFLGCAAGLVYYPFFLLPLWLSFYWQRGVRRFTSGFLFSLVGLTATLIFYSQEGFLDNLQRMYGVFLPAVDGLAGIWGEGGWHPYYRLPVLVAFIVLCVSFVFWPAQKNLATLMSCSAAIMTAAQFWHGYGGGLYMAWFLPLVLLTIFRPNLDDRIALTVVRPVGKRDRMSRDGHSNSSEPLAQAG